MAGNPAARTLDDPDLLPPGIDPDTRKLGIRTVHGRNEAATVTTIRVRDFAPIITDEPDSLGGTNTAPSPLETALAALVGCEGVILNGCAKALKFDYKAVEFECTGRIDVRGPKGVPGVRPYFETIDLVIRLFTDEPPERVAKLKKNVEFRCPILNLMRDAGVAVDIDWQVVDPDTQS